LTPRKLALSVFFGSVVINAVLGIAALVSGDFGDFESKILVTSLSVSAASVLSLAMFPARERGLLGRVPDVGIALSIVGFSLLVILAWTDWDSEELGKTSASILMFAIAAGYASLISLAVVHPKYANVVRSAYVLATILATMIATAIWFEPEDDVMPRVMGVISILLAAATVSIPVLHRLNRGTFSVAESADESSGVPGKEFTHVYLDRLPTICLNCGDSGISISEDSTYECGVCDARYRVEVPA
jgi:hypothetical protein